MATAMCAPPTSSTTWRPSSPAGTPSSARARAAALRVSITISVIAPQSPLHRGTNCGRRPTALRISILAPRRNRKRSQVSALHQEPRLLRYPSSPNVRAVIPELTRRASVTHIRGAWHRLRKDGMADRGDRRLGGAAIFLPNIHRHHIFKRDAVDEPGGRANAKTVLDEERVGSELDPVVPPNGPLRVLEVDREAGVLRLDHQVEPAAQAEPRPEPHGPRYEYGLGSLLGRLLGLEAKVFEEDLSLLADPRQSQVAPGPAQPLTRIRGVAQISGHRSPVPPPTPA